MQATRLWVLACLTFVGAAALSSCGDDSTNASGRPEPCDGCGGSSGESGERGVAPSSAASGGAPGPVASTGGARTLAAAGQGGTAVVAEAGSPSEPSGEQLSVCDRLTGLVPHADAVGRAYAKAIFADCRTTWLVPLEQDALVNFRNGLVLWSLAFWGCPGYEPVNTFGLVYQTPPLSQGDVALLIDHYLSAAQEELMLSPPEFAEMQATLERLAQPLVSSTSAEPSHSRCPMGAGGASAGGAAGAGGADTAGAAGTGGAGGVGGAGVR